MNGRYTMAQNHDDSDYLDKVLKNYGELKGELHLVELQRDPNASLGLSLVGSRDLATMSVFVVGIQPTSVAAIGGLIHVGDELLEINGHVLFGRSHLNASAIIKSISCVHIKILLIRDEDFTERMALSPLRLPSVTYKDSSVTLIPKKPKSISLDDAFSADVPSRTSDVLLRRQIATSQSSQNSNEIYPIECDCKDKLIVNSDDNLCTSQQRVELPRNDVVALIVNTESSTLEKESMPEPVCRAPVSGLGQAKGRRLQKVAQVEETDEEAVVTTPTPTLEAVAVASENNAGSNLNGSQLKHEAGALLDVTTVNVVEVEWNHRPLEEISPETSTNSSSPLHPLGGAALEDPSSCNIIPGRSNTIEIRKGKLGLGLKVIGGSDTILKAIIIYEVFKNGAAAKDGRLWPGDQILEVNGQDLREVTHGRAVQILRQVVATVKMMVFRDESIYRDDELYEAMTVELMKKPGKGLGLSIISRRDNNSGVLISDIVKGGVADADGRLLPGDQILAVNGDDMRNATQDYAAELLKTSMGKMILQIGRLKVTTKQNFSRNSSSSYNSRGMLKSESNTSDCKHTGRRTPKSNGPNHQEG